MARTATRGGGDGAGSPAAATRPAARHRLLVMAQRTPNPRATFPRYAVATYSHRRLAPTGCEDGPRLARVEVHQRPGACAVVERAPGPSVHLLWHRGTRTDSQAAQSACACACTHAHTHSPNPGEASRVARAATGDQSRCRDAAAVVPAPPGAQHTELSTRYTRGTHSPAQKSCLLV